MPANASLNDMVADTPEKLAETGNVTFLRQALSVLILFCVVTVLLLPFFGAEQARRSSTFVLAAIPAILALYLASTGRTQRALLVLAYGGWTAVTLAVVINGGLRTPVVFAYPVLILITGLGVSIGTTWRIAGLTLAVAPLLWLAEREKWLAPVIPLSADLILLLVPLGTLAAALLMNHHRRQLGRWEARLRSEGDELSRRMNEIAARETLLRLVVENVPALIHYYDREFFCLFANRPFQEFFGLVSTGVRGKTLEQLFGRDASQTLRPSVEHALAGKRVAFRCKLQRHSGEERQLDCNLVPDQDQDGTVRGYFAQMLDVTEQEHGEAVLRAIAEGTASATGEDFFRSLVRQLCSALDTPFAVLSERLPDGEQIHHHAFWHMDRHVDLPDQPLAGCPCGEAIVENRVIFHASGINLRFPDCGEMAELGMQSFYGMPLRNTAGEALGVLAVMSHGTLHFSDELAAVMAIFAARAGAELERQRAEATLRRSEEKFLRIFQSSPIPIVLLNLDGRIREVNDAGCQLWSSSAQEMIGKTSLELGFWQAEEERERWKERLLRDGRALGKELRVLTPGGQPRWLLVSSEIISLSNGPVVLSFLVDVTERKRSEEALARINDELELRVRQRTAELTSANRELETFAYSVSHDLRAPLRSIDGFSQILLTDYQDRLDEEGQSHLRRVRRAAQRMGAIIDDLLQLSRVTRQEMRRQPVDLAQMAREILDDLQNTTPERKVLGTVQADCCPAHGDAVLLRILLENLLGNAWKYTAHAQESRIEFGCDNSAGACTWFVRDNGVGFDMAHAERLFRPFERLHHIHEFEGTGIGLASAARIVHRHGGRIDAKALPGEGATFHFTLD